jgi:hypothetical protein
MYGDYFSQLKTAIRVLESFVYHFGDKKGVLNASRCREYLRTIQFQLRLKESDAFYFAVRAADIIEEESDFQLNPIEDHMQIVVTDADVIGPTRSEAIYQYLKKLPFSKNEREYIHDVFDFDFPNLPIGQNVEENEDDEETLGESDTDTYDDPEYQEIFEFDNIDEDDIDYDDKDEDHMLFFNE